MLCQIQWRARPRRVPRPRRCGGELLDDRVGINAAEHLEAGFSNATAIDQLALACITVMG